MHAVAATFFSINSTVAKYVAYGFCMFRQQDGARSGLTPNCGPGWQCAFSISIVVA